MAGLPVDSQNTTVVDVTYLCNATCGYCRWGSSLTPGRVHRSAAEILIPKETLEALGTQRIVISGGEPRLHPEMNEILGYYHDLVDDVIVITNGYGLDAEEVLRLVRAGATGVSASLDSLFPEEQWLTRRTPPSLHERIVSNLERIAALPRTFELGINSVVTHPTANWRTVKRLLEWGLSTKVDFVKFQPLFNDGYVQRNQPELMLVRSDLPGLMSISQSLETIPHPPTNPAGFWNDITQLVSGRELLPSACGLGPRHSIAVDGRLSVCYWLDTSLVGQAVTPLSHDHAKNVRTKFEQEKLNCKVGFHCFCTQNLTHQWKESSV